MVVLENGREITFDTLMVATGLGQDFDQIAGLEGALKDINCPVFTTFDYHPDNVGFIFLDLSIIRCIKIKLIIFNQEDQFL